MSSSYEKIAFVWTEPKEKVVVPDRCEFTKVIPELEDIGVWRIFADTDVENIPMRIAFEKAGYEINK
ncbi:hypothetical protein M3661_12665 [Paenibacillus sp. MER 180]|uniref:hypothetical protein n=1 Tax=Paenibacillus sp. MER 180 TaxID=2939570 RepID=UPI00203F9F63|nr:hypothetical protein [Paenibacillus sp. MER 180]MCM3290982.1 hypothetical protein [Paenibacillus sp. MER 180]